MRALSHPQAEAVAVAVTRALGGRRAANSAQSALAHRPSHVAAARRKRPARIMRKAGDEERISPALRTTPSHSLLGEIARQVTLPGKGRKGRSSGKTRAPTRGTGAVLLASQARVFCALGGEVFQPGYRQGSHTSRCREGMKRLCQIGQPLPAHVPSPQGDQT